MLGGTFEPAYLLNISAIDSFTQASTNKRNAALVQAFLSEVLSVPADRGVVKFTPISEDCLATNARTIQGEISRVEGGDSSVKKGSSKDRRKSNMTVRSRSNSTLGNAPALPDKKKDNRKSFMSIRSRKGSTMNGGDTLDPRKSISKRRMSLHPPPNMMDESPSSSGSSTPAIPNPVFLEQPVKNSSTNRSRSSSKVDSTATLLNSASNALSQHASSIKPPKSPSQTSSSRTQVDNQSMYDSDNSKKASNRKAQRHTVQPGSLPTQQRSRQQSLPQQQPMPTRGRSKDDQPLPTIPFNNGSSPNLPAGRKGAPAFSNSSRPSTTKSAGGHMNGGGAGGLSRFPDLPPPPPEPMNTTPTPKIGKRKSFIALFRRGGDTVKAS
jgi:hypothetical protein